MINYKILRILFLPIGLATKLMNLANEGARDIHNRVRFKDSLIENGCTINKNSEIAPNTHIYNNCIVNNSKIASYSYIGKNCLIQNTHIGKFCSISNDVLIGLGKHPLENFSTSPLFYRINNALKIKLVNANSDFQEYQPIDIGNDVWIGTRAIILDGVTVGHGSIIAANSVVTKDIPPYSVVGGVPAKIIKYRFQGAKIEKLQKLQWWNLPLKEVKLKIKELNNLKNDPI